MKKEELVEEINKSSILDYKLKTVYWIRRAELYKKLFFSLSGVVISVIIYWIANWILRSIII